MHETVLGVVSGRRGRGQSSSEMPLQAQGPVVLRPRRRAGVDEGVEWAWCGAAEDRVACPRPGLSPHAAGTGSRASHGPLLARGHSRAGPGGHTVETECLSVEEQINLKSRS